MASLYKKPVILRDPDTGNMVKTKSKKCWGRYKDTMGREKRLPLTTDKRAAEAMLNELVKKVEREQAGLKDPFEDEAKRPLHEHIAAYKKHLRDKGNTDQYVHEVTTKVRRLVQACRWSWIADRARGDVQRFLADLRRGGLSVQTSNHYLRAIKQFSRWLVRDRRAYDDPLAHLSKMNVAVDRRHERRALSEEEFAYTVHGGSNVILREIQRPTGAGQG